MPQSVHHIISPAEGPLMAFRCAAVILGGRNPALVDVTSNTADESGVVVPMPTCACTIDKTDSRMIVESKCFVMIAMCFI